MILKARFKVTLNRAFQTTKRSRARTEPSAAPGPTRGDVSSETLTMDGSIPGIESIAEFGVNFIQINFTNRHLVGRILEIIPKEIEILFVDFVDQMHR